MFGDMISLGFSSFLLSLKTCHIIHTFVIFFLENIMKTEEACCVLSLSLAFFSFFFFQLKNSGFLRTSSIS